MPPETATRGDVLAILGAIAVADGDGGVIAAGSASQLANSQTLADVASVVIKDGRILVSLEIGSGSPLTWEPARAEAQRQLAGLPGVNSALVSLTAERLDPPASKAVASPVAGGKPAASAAGSPSPRGIASLRGIKRIIAVASGKGGVGKSTTACNLALALAARGLAVGVLDADIYGPSMPKLFGLKGQPRILSNRTLIPLEAYGVKVMSIGFVVEADSAMVWRGPMVAAAITQMLRDVAWGDLDVLVVDMPPGTGDAQLTLAQATPLSGAVVVSTPQDLSLIDARRGIAMFRDVGVPVLGLVENMSYFVCDECGKHHHIFAHGGARAEALKLGVPFLGEVPLEADIRERSDAGLPVVVSSPDSAGAKAFAAIAANVWASVNAR